MAAMSLSQSSVLSNGIFKVPADKNRSFVLPQRITLRKVVSVKAAVSVIPPETVIPKGDRVLLKLGEKKEVTAGGVLLPSAAVKYEKVLFGEVIAVGDKAEGVAKGDKVLVSDLDAYEIKVGSPDEKFVFAKSADILAIAE